jgi:hypothetical protein
LYKYVEADALLGYLFLIILVVLIELWFISLVWRAFKELESLEKDGRVGDCTKA